MGSAVKASPKHPVLIDKYLSDAIEVDVDAISDGTNVVVAGSWSISKKPGCIRATRPVRCHPIRSVRRIVEQIRRQMKALALELDVIGLMNAQFAVKDGIIYVLEVNPRGSRTVPFVSKAIGVPLAKLAMKIMMGKSLDGAGIHRGPRSPLICP